MNAPVRSTKASAAPQINVGGPSVPGPHHRRTLTVVLATASLSVVVLASIGFFLWEESSVTKCAGCTNALDRALALSTSRDSSGRDPTFFSCVTTACNFYDFSIVVNSTGLTLADLFFQVKDPEGAVVTTNVALAAVESDGRVLANYTFSPGGWTPSSSTATHLTDQDTILVYSWGSPPEDLSGFTLYGLGDEAYSGAISAEFY
jgi:hypothetical protein